jgi:hypothetical protein
MLLGNALVNLTAAIVPGTGTFLQYDTITTSDLTFGLPATVTEEGLYEIDSIQYVFVTGAAVTAGAIGVQLLMPWGGLGGTWVQMTTPNSATGAAFTLVATLAASTVYNGSLGVTGSIFVPCVGVRLSYTGLLGGNIINGALYLTKR